MMCLGAWCSIPDNATIFGNQIMLFLWHSSGITMELNLFHGIHMDCSMESMVDTVPIQSICQSHITGGLKSTKF